MKRFLHLICLLVAALLLPAALLISHGLPVDTRPYVEEKYAGWSGVLRAWVCAEWSCAGSFTHWLNSCAASFEREHEGVYIEFTPVSADVFRQMPNSGIRPPELVLFSPGTISDFSSFKEMNAPTALRRELRGLCARAYPVAMGGYIRVCNSTISAEAAIADLGLPTDNMAHCFSAAAVALMSDASRDAPSEESLPDAGLDLGLPTLAIEEQAPVLISDEALECFIRGELPTAIVSQAELARLVRLRNAGRGPDWDCVASGAAAYTDQLLLVGTVAQTGDAAAEREALAETFAEGLLMYDAQAALADVGAFSVTGECIYSNFSAYAPLDALLNSRELLTPRDMRTHFSANCSSLLHACIAGNTEGLDALQQLRLLLAP